jgi:diguanylate cyclase (GGDEF)-like protein
MIESYDFLKSVLDTLTHQIVVIDDQGDIQYVNKSWVSFGQDNACLIEQSWSGVNYLVECDKAGAMGDDFGINAAAGIRSVINEQQELFYFEYPCHSSDEKRWFIMRVASFSRRGEKYFVISHECITERVIAEERILEMSHTDGLTDIPNRRHFDEFIESEWERCRRLHLPISLAMIDIDHFKLLNDAYGHQVGDESLKAVGSLLKSYCKRPGDLCARYGGEEFLIVYGNTELYSAKSLLKNFLEDFRALKIPNKNSPVLPILTASVGLVTTYPTEQCNVESFIREADNLLYAAKTSGRNLIHSSDYPWSETTT